MSEEKIIEVKKYRVEIDSLIQRVGATKSNAEETLAFRALQQAKHWLGESLSILGAQYPYPNSKDPSNTIVDPTADVAKL